MSKSIIVFSAFIAFVLLVQSCYNEKIRTTSDTILEFSHDTIPFDTVFTTVGSATRILKVYNRYADHIMIDKISLDDEANGTFRLNIDGVSDNSLTDILLAPNDSIYVFVETTIRPDDPLTISPFIIEDYISFDINTNQQKVLLSAYGQNANYIPGDKKGGRVVTICNNFETISFDDPKPYVIYGILFVDSCTVQIPAGANIYVHGGIGYTESSTYSDGIIAVTSEGVLQVDGTVDSPVTFQGDRLESAFNDIKGQWGGIYLLEGSKGSYFNNAIIDNSVLGIRIDSAASVDIRSTIFRNQSANAILGRHVDRVYLENCLIEGSSSNAVSISYGGDIEMNYCTLVGYGSSAGVLGVTNFQCIEPTCMEGFYINPVNLAVKNSIFVGSSIDQVIMINESMEEDFTYQFENCILQSDELLDVPEFSSFLDDCIDCLVYNEATDSLFLDSLSRVYTLDTMSIAEGKAQVINGITVDLNGKARNSEFPDIGCYEFVE